jgi:hypothetical protein
MTPQELEILKAISCKDVETFLPAGATAAQAKVFDALVEVLPAMRRLGWLEVEVAERATSQPGRLRGKYIAAAARCTEAGRRALRLIGE